MDPFYINHSAYIYGKNKRIFVAVIARRLKSGKALRVKIIKVCFAKKVISYPRKKLSAYISKNTS